MINMKSFKELAHDLVTKVDEDAPANAVGTGANVALPPAHEPGVKKKKKKKHDPILINNLKRKVQENNDNNSMMLKGVLDKLEQLDDIVDEVSGVKKEIIGQVEETPQYTTFKDKYMNGELLIERKTIGAMYESVIAECHSLNSLGENKFKDEILNNSIIQEFLKLVESTKGNPGSTAFAVKGQSDDKIKDIMWNFSKLCKSKLPGTVDAGAGQSKRQVSEPWIEYSSKKGGIDTSKADILVGSNPTSVKGPKALLTSGEQKEARATVISALASINAGKELESKLLGAVDEFVTNTRTIGADINAGVLKKMSPEEAKKTGNEKIKQILDDQDKTKNKINAIFESAFKEPGVGYAFAREAMMGYEKFGGKAFPNRKNGYTQAMATHLLVWDYSMSKMKYVTISDSEINNVAKQMKVDTSLKSGSYKVNKMKAGYSFYQSFKLDVKTTTDEFDKLEMKANEEIEHHRQMLTEGVINEFKFLDKIKQIAQMVFEKIKGVFNKLVEKVKQLVDNVKTLIKEGINLALFELDVNVKHNNIVSFKV